MEHVQVTAPDLARRAAMERTRGRLVIAAAGFAVLFLAVVGKLADATIIDPQLPRPVAQMRRPEPPPPLPPDGAIQSAAAAASHDFGTRVERAAILDRNGEIMAISLPTAALFANPREMIDPADAARKLATAVPRLNEKMMARRLATDKQFVYLARHLSPREQLTINTLGIPGVYFEKTERRRYPLGRVAAQVLGGVDVDGKGVAGVERFFDQRLRDEPDPLRLSIDVRVQAVVRDELDQAMVEFNAIGATGIVMDVRTGEVLAMVSLPDYDANDVGHATADQRFNRAVTGMYEPGSTFKLQTASMALDSGAAQLWYQYDAADVIHIGRFTITDFEGKHRWLYFPEVLAYSSNLGAARMALSVGAEKQREWLRRMGMFGRLGIELPEAGMPIVQPASRWKEVVTMTVGFGHGIAVSPLHVVRGTAAVANGGILLRPTILARPPDAPPPKGERVMQQSTSDIMRKMMRLVVTDGYGKTAEVPGYFVGGKTGTAEKVGGKGGYRKHTNVAAFMSVFPMNAPRYAVYMMLDEPKANASTHGYATAGWVAAPAAGRVIARIGPMLGLLPATDDAAAIQATLAVPLQPGKPPGAHQPPLLIGEPSRPVPRPPTHVAPPARDAARAPGRMPARLPVMAPPPRDARHEAMLAPGPAPVSGRQTVAVR
ncbi:MAG: penicillin-binding protein 2 [Rhodospirillales bacterium]|nr:penicillin-binding protein 2 [Rhodospirillales bacterium]